MIAETETPVSSAHWVCAHLQGHRDRSAVQEEVSV